MLSSGIIKVLQWFLAVFAIVSLAISLFAFYSYFFGKPPEKEGFEMISGDVEKYEKKTSEHTGENYLDIYLKGNPLRFRVSVGGYDEYFKHDLFYGFVRPGNKINIEVMQKYLDNPVQSPRDPVKTVFIETMWDEKNKYIAWEDVVKWRNSDKVWALIVGTVFFAGSVFLSLIAFLYLPKLETGVARGAR